MNMFFFFFNDTATTEIYTLSLHDALPISCSRLAIRRRSASSIRMSVVGSRSSTSLMTYSLATSPERSEEHTSELQSQSNLVCRLLLEKKNKGLVHVRFALRPRDVNPCPQL